MFSVHGFGETIQEEHKSKAHLSSAAPTECRNQASTAQHSRKHLFCNTGDISGEAEREFTNEMKQRITFLLNCLYADEFVHDMFLLEFIALLFAAKKTPNYTYKKAAKQPLTKKGQNLKNGFML